MPTTRLIAGSILSAAAVLAALGCGGSAAEQDRTFSTSGSKEADQRADQRMARDAQLKGGADEGKKETKATGAVIAEGKKTLYDRLGNAEGVNKIVDDFVTRIVADPQVNFERKGVTRGGLSFSRGQSMEWKADKVTLGMVKKNLADFIGLKSGGPNVYNGPEFSVLAKDEHATNAEYDAAVGDMKATLEKLQIADQEQKELLALMESARPQLVEEH